MVDRGNCTFTKKANSAQNANASAILIINNQKGKILRKYRFCSVIDYLVQHVVK